MIRKVKQSGFSAVELLVSLFVAAMFLSAGYQLYSIVIKNGGETRAQSTASSIAYNYLQQYKLSTTAPCIPQALLTDQPITVSGLSDVTITVSISCPYTALPSISKISAVIKYGNPQTTITNSTYTSGYINI